jgi:hypothetical protein
MKKVINHSALELFGGKWSAAGQTNGATTIERDKISILKKSKNKLWINM